MRQKMEGETTQQRVEEREREALRQIIAHQRLPCTVPLCQEESFFICTNLPGIFLIQPGLHYQSWKSNQPMIILWLACQHFPMWPTPVAWICLGLLLTSAHQQCTQQQPRYEIIQWWVMAQPESPLRLDLFVLYINRCVPGQSCREHRTSYPF